MSDVIESALVSSSPEETLALDIEFHRLVGVASGNGVLASLLDGLSAPTNRARMLRARTETGVQVRTAREHQAIVDAIAAHEPDIAHAAMVNHVAGVEAWLRKIH